MYDSTAEGDFKIMSTIHNYGATVFQWNYLGLISCICTCKRFSSQTASFNQCPPNTNSLKVVSPIHIGLHDLCPNTEVFLRRIQ